MLLEHVYAFLLALPRIFHLESCAQEMVDLEVDEWTESYFSFQRFVSATLRAGEYRAELLSYPVDWTRQYILIFVGHAHLDGGLIIRLDHGCYMGCIINGTLCEEEPPLAVLQILKKIQRALWEEHQEFADWK